MLIGYRLEKMIIGYNVDAIVHVAFIAYLTT